MNLKTKVAKKASSDDVETSLQIVASTDDLLKQILLRLPMNSLIRFKSVSKHWNSLIANPRFCYLRNPNPNPAVGLFFRCSNVKTSYEYVPLFAKKSTNPPFRELNFIEEPSGITISESCNGLLLCCSSDDHGRRYYVYNPTTSKFSTLPKLDEGGGVSSRELGMSLAFDPSKSPHYKVVCVRTLVSGSMPQFEVYSSETDGLWKKCEEPYTYQVNFEVNYQNGVYWNRAIHWICHLTKDCSYFNLDDHMLRRMPMLPSSIDFWNSDWKSDYRFEESCDHLHYIEISEPWDQCDVYEMKRDYSEWFVKYKIDTSPVYEALNMTKREKFDLIDWWWYYAFSLTTLVRGEKDKDSCLILTFSGKAIIKYNFVYGTCETIYAFEDDEVKFSSTNGFQCIESLCFI